MSTLKVSTISPLGADSTNTITIGTNGTDTVTGAGSMVPAFFARLSSVQSISSDTSTKIQVDSEVFDSDDKYDNSNNYRFTPEVAGKYFVFAAVGRAQVQNILVQCLVCQFQKMVHSIPKRRQPIRWHLRLHYDSHPGQYHHWSLLVYG